MFGTEGFNARPGSPGDNGQKGEPAEFAFNREFLRGEPGYDGRRWHLHAFSILRAIKTVIY